MKIAIIGGRQRNNVQLERLAREAGHEIELRDGDLHGSGVQEIRTTVMRSDVTVILTAPNSHGAVSVAKAAAKQMGTPTLIVDRLSAARFKALLEAVGRRKELGWPWGIGHASEMPGMMRALAS
jgi:Uncharacterized protein conserved in bacteria (DUF2325)